MIRFTYKIFSAFSLMLLAVSTAAQAPIQVTAPMTGTPAAGSYFSYSNITLSPNFSFTAAAGSSLSLYIANPDCQLLANSFSQNQNYIVTSVPRVGGMKTVGSTPNSGDFANRTSCDLMQSVQYFDGLGRPLQAVQVKGSTANKDVVQPFVYDQFGREVQKYLPYPAQGTADGSYKSTATSDQSTFYNSPASGSGVSQITAPYAITNFEPSPLDRIVEQGAPGAVWQPVANSTSGHTNKLNYTTNNVTALTDVANSYLAALYTVTINSDQSRALNRASGANGNYAAGQLYVTIRKDENWVSGKIGTSEEYKDKEGHVVLKRTFNQVGTTVQVLSTYYVYDDLGNLAFVLPPISAADGGIPAQATLDNVCYLYQYDERNRLVQKRLPGKGWEYMIYNLLDQLIFTQDANQRSQTPQVWSFIKYDAMGRVVMTGTEGGHTETRPALQSYVTTTLKNTSSGFTEWETPNASGTHGYTNTAFPTGAGVVTLMVNYYDDYNNMPNLPTGYQVSSGVSTMTKGLLTASKTAVLNTPSNYLWKVHYYDDLGREIRTYQQHYLGGTANASNFDVVLTSYNFNNQDTSTNRRHFTTALIGTPKLTINNIYRYDHMGRKIQTFEQINGGTNVLLSQTDYNEIGQVQTKHLHGASGAAPFLQNIAYTYNERGWLKSSNAPLFAMQLTYNNGNNAPFNGNISNQTWQVQGGTSKMYNYSYDALNRLNAGIYTPSTENYSEQGIDYDLVGNIQHLTRGAPSLPMPPTYTYTYTGNQLQSVSGLTTGTYQYDPNGNVKFDARTQKNITYNLLNLPQSITATGFNLSYTYDATGQKLRKNNGATTTDYIGGIQYENGNIIFIQTEEGRAINSGGSYLYEYSLTDHLGNSRLSFDQNSATAIKQQDDYYPFGMEISRGTTVSPKNEYLYNKKELQEELGQYDYGARFYDPVIGRWTSVDPLSELDRRLSPYIYGFDDPMRFTDPDGMWPDWLDHAIASAKQWLGAPAEENYATAVSQVAGAAYGTGQLPVPATNGQALLMNLGQAGYQMAASMPGTLKVRTNVPAPEVPEIATVPKTSAHTEPETPQGGAYKDLSVGTDEQRHHLVADAVSPVSKKAGPSIVMKTVDHRQTGSWGNSKESQAFQARQFELLAKGDFEGAMNLGINDVRAKFGTQYDPAIQQAQAYTDKLNKTKTTAIKQ
ncbi:RHS repeat-associated core domain-containing protein [Mucilaginibacter sp. OK268]|uniref:DUF6443 domain-containing protein n=1 Tax=Mucilaginibacter sp. OK268 TaxID=1881048 RepID=UPI000880BBE3|nr:DUF6443 domain-containing protein [Mucilaginibacter sp. OK268]SDQ01467.1 RHS repeat-associated core domain-containing protein [Mucilaginibacter sp. OK268]